MTSSIKKSVGTGASETQATVAKVWSEVLQAGEIDVTRNFFDLGGDSLKAIEVISRLQAVLHVELPLISFFEDPTIAHLAAVADELLREKGGSNGGGQPAVSATQAAVAKVWSEVLQVEKVEAAQNFFDLGGDSLKAIEVISRLQGLLNVELPLIAFFEDPTIAHLTAVADELRRETGAEASLASPAQAYEEISPATVKKAPLSFAQLMYWLLQQMDPLGHLYHQTRVVRIRGAFRADVLQSAVNEICRRHEVLRTRLEAGTEEPAQVIDRRGRVEVRIEDFSAVAAESREKAAMDSALKELQLPFDLATDLPMRVLLLRLAGDEHVLVNVMHHVVADGQSGTIFFDELSAIYNALAAGKAPGLPELAFQYPEYAAGQREQMRGERLEKEIEYWRSHLQGAPARLNLPTDRARPVRPGHAGGQCGVLVPPATVERLKALALASGSTLFSAITGALRILMQRWTSQSDMVIGTVASNRTRAGADRVIGVFLNFLPLRNSVSADESAADVLGREKQVVRDAFAHGDCPFVKIAAAAGAGRVAEVSPLYNVALLLQNYPETKFSGDGFSGVLLELKSETALLDLRFLAEERDGGLQLDCEFRTELFDRVTMQSLLAGFAGVLEALAESPGRLVSEFVIPQQLIEQASAARARERKQTIAITSTFTAEPVEAALGFWMKELGIGSEVSFAPYNQIFQQLLDPASLVRCNRDGVNIVFLRLTDWQRFEEDASIAEARQKIERNVGELTGTLQAVSQGLPAPMFVCLCPPERKFASDSGWSEFLVRTEQRLASELESIPAIHVITAAQVNAFYPVDEYEDEYADKLGHIPYTSAFFTAIGSMLARRIFSLRSAPRKVIVLDCDNTLWKGVCGEEGPMGVIVDAPRRALQEFMLKQVESGMLLCLCSKNAEEDVRAVFAQNTGMALRESDIAARRVNWNSKSQNLRELAGELQLGLDSFVFVDDNPIECAEVEAQCPEVLTLLLPQDAGEIPGFLKNVWAFDHWKITAEDARRTEMYRQNAEREEIRKQASTLDDFLAGLELKLDIHAMQELDLARVSQLTERTNQFNFTTIRRNESEVREFLAGGGQCLVVNLSDRFGDYGLVGVILYSFEESELAIDTFLLSCRALGRKVEHNMLTRLGEIAKEHGVDRVVAQFVATKKNQPALDFLQSVGRQFQLGGDENTQYDFPASYAAEVHRQALSTPAPESNSNSKSKEERAKSPRAVSTNPEIAGQNRVLARIATQLGDVSGITRAIEETQRVTRQPRGVLVAPRTAVEEMVAGIWSQLLNLDRIDIHDNFFALGGHSLTATQAVARVRQTLGVELPLRAMFEAPTVAQFAKRIEAARQDGSVLQAPPITRVEKRDRLALSFAQQRLWFLDQLEPGSPLYNLPQMFRMRGQLDVVAVERALNKIVERHDSLRTTFALHDDEPVQVIAPALRIELPITDLSGVPQAQREERVQQLAAEEARRPFNLATGPVIRAQLLRLGSENHALLLTMHHIVGDRWSMGLVSEELAIHYRAFTQGTVPSLPDLAIQYADFAVWQRQWLQGDVLNAQLKYWKEQLAGAPQVLEVPTDRPRPAQMSTRGAMQSLVVPRGLVEKLEGLSRAEGVTLFMTLLAAFQVLLSRYSGQEDIVVGSPIAGRNFAELEPLIGFFVNTLPLRGDLSGDPTFRELLARIKEVCLRGYAQQDIPFEKLVEELQPERSLSHSPIFQVLFALQNAPMQALQLPGVELERSPIHGGTSIFDMSWFAIEVPEGLLLRVEYCTDLFDETTIARALRHFEALAESAVAEPGRKISELQLLTSGERGQLLAEWNATEAEYPRDLCMHQLLEQQARRTPEKVAARFGSDRITYSELNSRANQLARYLQARGVGTETLVGIYVERSVEMLVGLLGILKAGGTYVPLDPAYPKERIGFILEDAQAPVLIAQSSLVDSLPAHSATVVVMDAERAAISCESKENVPISPQPHNSAYVLYTSGSTGKPKGVQITHQNLVNFLCSMRKEPGLVVDDRLLAVTTLSFDIAGLELYLPLITGAEIILASREEAADGQLLLNLLRESKATVMQATPATWRLLIEAGWIGTPELKVLCGGEALPGELAAQLLPRCAELWNMYGPTETTIWSSVYRVTGDVGSTAPIGHPIANTTFYVLDAKLQPMPVGITGDLYIGGEGVARGYYRRPELTAERFVPDPFRPGQRIYKTGDQAKYLADGNVQYLGRSDFQVKVRGYRIELGEIESVLAQAEGVQQTVVTVREDTPGDRRLVGYVVPQAGANLTTVELQAGLRKHLPEYMVPAAIVQLQSLPLTPNGKVDRKALPAPEPGAASESYVAPRNATEERVAAIWAEVLHLERVSVESDFFALGGHSLLAAQVISRLRQAFQIEIPLKAMFEAPKLASLAERINATKRGLEIPTITRISREKPLPASFAQQRLWFLDQMEPNSQAFNLAYTVKIVGPVDAEAMQRSLDAIAQQQEGLRTSFRSDGNEPLQIIQPSVLVPFETMELSKVDSSIRESEARRLIAEEANRPFDLTRAPLLRALLLNLSKDEHYLVLKIHHVISDRWSISILMRDLARMYGAAIQGKAVALPELPLQYADYGAWQREWLHGEILEKRLAYWREKLKDAPPVVELPTDRPRPAVESSHGEVASLSFSRELADKLNRLGRERGATLFMTLLAGFQALLSRYSGQDDVVVGTAVANRAHPDLENVIGFFLNTLPLRTRLSGDPTFAELLERVKDTALGAYANQDMPFEKLVEGLRPERSLSHSPLIQVYFVLQNAAAEADALKAQGWTPVSSGLKTVKGDMFLSMQETPDGIAGRMEYSSDLFVTATMVRMGEHFRVLLEAAVKNPTLRLSQLPLLTERERKQIVVEWNATEADCPRGLCLHELIEEQAEQGPHAVACIQPGDGTGQDRQITYGELNHRANQLARALRKRGAGPGERVGIFVERSIEMMVGLLGIQKSGAAYVPLDPAYPAERIRLTLEDAQVPVLLTQSALRSQLPEHNAQVLCIDSDWDEIANESATNLGKIAMAEDVAYVIFTSGSTGRPKGVQIPHRAVVNLLTFMAQELRMGADDVFPALASFAFDMCIPELYLALVSGGRVVIGGKDLAADGEELAALLRRTGATIVHATPTTWRLLLEAGFSGKGLKRVIGAEPLPRELCARLLTADASLYNFYGPTETTVWSTYHHFASPDEPVVVGKPIANTQVYILDPNLQPLPAGMYGEIYIGGDGVARGYLNRPELNAEKFVDDPFAAAANAKMYRTGDVARFLADGRIEFQGRADHQVKLRGYRIELGEIEAVLGKHAAVKQGVVVAREDTPGDKRLVAYVVAQSDEPINVAELREWVGSRLPEYMVPTAWVQMEKLPLSANGKVDRKNLPAPEYVRPELKGDYATPRTPEEEVVAAIWAEVLKYQQVGIHDDFFELGGHSLLATQVISRIRQAFKIDMPLRTLFEAPTVAGLAERAAALVKRLAGIETVPPMQRASRQKPLPLSFAQQRLWFLDQLEPGNPLYNVAYVTRLAGPVDAQALEDSLNEIVRRHESLRTTFRSLDDQPVQVIVPKVQVTLRVLDASHMPSLEEREEEARRLATIEIQKPFDLATGPLLRPVLIKIGENDHGLVLNTHHIISDRWSMGVLSQELAALYEANLQGRPSPLAELQIQYADYAVWQREFLSGEKLDKQIAYWRQKLEGAPPVLELPTDRARKGTEQFWGAQHRQPIPKELADDVRALSRGQRGTFFMALLAGFQLLMTKLTGQNDIVIGTDLANRNQVETEKLIGFFVNLLPIRAQVDPEASFSEFFQQVREVSLETMAHQDVPFDKLVQELRPERSLTHNPLVQVLFVMQNTPTMITEFGGLKLSPLGVGGASRFDLVMFVNNPESDASTIWAYNPNLFDASTIARMANSYELLLKTVCADPEIKLEAVFATLGEADKQQRGSEQKTFQEAGLAKLKKARRKVIAEV
jgi:amino acid adenylation domain-containing protein/FkbH-like protein